MIRDSIQRRSKIKMGLIQRQLLIPIHQRLKTKFMKLLPMRFECTKIQDQPLKSRTNRSWSTNIVRKEVLARNDKFLYHLHLKQSKCTLKTSSSNKSRD